MGVRSTGLCLTPASSLQPLHLFQLCILLPVGLFSIRFHTFISERVGIFVSCIHFLKDFSSNDPRRELGKRQ